jgi:hypothetical protein
MVMAGAGVAEIQNNSLIVKVEYLLEVECLLEVHLPAFHF